MNTNPFDNIWDLTDETEDVVSSEQSAMAGDRSDSHDRTALIRIEYTYPGDHFHVDCTNAFFTEEQFQSFLNARLTDEERVGFSKTHTFRRTVQEGTRQVDYCFEMYE